MKRKKLTRARKLPPVPRKLWLRRVVILCCSFARNLVYYRVGRSKEHLQLLDPAKTDRASTNFWRAVNGNFLDMCVLEWCKLFGDPNAHHYWGKVVTDPHSFEAELLSHLGLNKADFQKVIEVMREYRDKWVAHLDSKSCGTYPNFDVPKKAVWFYHAHIVKHEAEPNDLAGLQVELDLGYQETLDEANAVYAAFTK